jgi:hypothetical protein
VWGLQSIGEALRAARMANGHAIQDAAVATRIRAGYLEALENEEFDRLGGAVYVKGFLRTYATWLGLDPGPLLEAFRTHEGSEGPPQVFQGGLRPIEAGFGGFGHRRRVNWFVLGSVAAFLVLVVGLVSLFGSLGGAERQPPVAAPETTARSRAPVAAPPPTTTVARPAGVRLVVRYRDASWSRVTVDGAAVFEGILQAGARRTFQGNRRIELMLGNAGAVRLNLNGRDLGLAGGSGEVWRGTFTPNGRR